MARPRSLITSSHLQVLAGRLVRRSASTCGALGRVVGAAFAPSRCANCDWFEPNLFCDWCAPRLRAVPTPHCACCGEPFDPLAQVLADSICAECRDNRSRGVVFIEIARSLWLFSGPARRAVYRLKYHRQWSLAAPMGEAMAHFVRQNEKFSNIALIAPVPLFAWRQWQRGFNQSELLAQSVARELNLPYLNTLRRVRHTPSQTTLKRVERQSNVRDAFAVAPGFDVASIAARGAILLIDDVYTTGATLRECARQLQRQAAPQQLSVYALTWARQPKPQFKPTAAAHVTALL